MAASQRIRQIHRWVSLVFTVIVIVNLVALATHSNGEWVGFLALPPLLLLLGTGLYLFILPYTKKGRAS